VIRRFAPAAVYVLLVGLVLPGSPLADDTALQPPGTPPVDVSSPVPAQPPIQAIKPQPSPAPSPPPPPKPQPAAAPASAPRTPAPEQPIAVAAGPGSVTIRDFSFSPGSITIDAGDTVTWTNSGQESHTATGNGFDTGLLSNGQSGSHTFSQAGSYSYICTPHPFMKGTVVVRAASTGGGSGSGGSGGPQGGGAGSTGAGSGSSGNAGGATLPRSGADALSLAVLGFGLLALGFVSRRRLES
jgi:plastocyanin